MNFNELNLIQPLLDAVAGAGYETPTPIQEATIPLVLAGKDVLGCAQTGTGKTAAFALPMLQELYSSADRTHGARRPIRALIVTPTRELATQISENFDTYGANLPLNNCVIFGGVKQSGQVERLKAGVDILVATPGRLNDLIGQGFIKLNKLEIFVLDEADRMLDMGFINDIRQILRCIPQTRQTLFFSATMPPDVERLAMTILHKPATVKVDPENSTVESISQSLYYVDKVNKGKLLASLLKGPDVRSALVFTRTKHGADKVVRELAKANIEAMAIHGNKSQNARQEALHRFTNGDIAVLIATDIAARGIDIPELSHVFNYDIPEDPETYIHRIGRTGRAGLSGCAISFCCYDERDRLSSVEKLIKKRIPVTESPWPMEVCTCSEKPQHDPRPARGQRPAYRRSARR
ncbi:MAG: DEAD/DEAH box helicase [Oscillospiraceae bacterium]|nr:DEAD/DEAH box helicase [Oscillospiraceae bacterium]